MNPQDKWLVAPSMRIKIDNDPEQQQQKSTETIGGIVNWEFFSYIIYEWHNKARESHFQIYKAQELYNPDILLEKNYLNTYLRQMIWE